MKNKVLLVICIIIIMLYGCVENSNSIDSEQPSGSISSMEEAESILVSDLEFNSDVVSEAESNSISEPVEEIPELNLEGMDEDMAECAQSWRKEVQSIITDEELEQLNQIEWDENIRPYIEYDWIGDERLERQILYLNAWTMYLGDLNQDGQPEMMISEYLSNMMEDKTYVYTIKDGKVVYCGAIIASVAYEDRQYWIEDESYLPVFYIDVYRNKEGKYRYLSCEDWMYSSGYFQIYESLFDGTKIEAKAVYGLDYWYDTDGNMNYDYYTGDYLERESKGPDNINYPLFRQEFAEYMEGYEKVDVEFIISDYRVPAISGELPEEYKDNVRNNIRAGFAKALGYL